MLISELKPNIIVRGPIFPEPVQVIGSITMGESVKLIGEGMKSSMYQIFGRVEFRRPEQ